MRYRADVEGLRTLAIVPIVLFHAGVASISGGFVGVDVFYVISGYLITSIIEAEILADRFSLVDFYRKRAVRILPAAFVMVALVVAFGTRVLFPDELRSLAASAAAAIGFVSNVWFWNAAGYFGPAAESLPLLHTWSLGVEQQFYLVYPLLLIAVRRIAADKVVPVLAVLGLASFALSLGWAVTAPTSAFYLLPSRIWEMGLGGLVALGAFPRVRSAHTRDKLALAGLAANALALALIRESSLFPAPWGLLPAGGTALLIAYGERAITARVLTLGPIRHIGSISYSLYLWHWPIITFWRLDGAAHLSLADTVAVVALSLLAAELSFRLVEWPCLTRWRAARSGPVLAAHLAAGLVLISATWVTAHFADDLRTYPPEVKRVAAYADYGNTADNAAQFVEGTCFVSLGMVYDRDNCLATTPGKRTMLVFGDSHAAQYWRAIADRYADWTVLQATGSACRPMHGVSTEEHCNDVMPLILDRFLPTHKVDVIVLAARWLAGEDQILAREIAAMQRTGARVVVIGPVVEYEGETPRLLADAMMHGDPERIGRRRLMERRDRDRAMAPVVKATGADWVSAWDVECPNDHCRLFDPEGGPMHFDYGHLTLAASRLVAAALPAF